MDRPSPDPSVVLLDSSRLNRSKIRLRPSEGLAFSARLEAPTRQSAFGYRRQWLHRLQYHR